MTEAVFIPYDTHIMIRKAVVETFRDIYVALHKTQLFRGVARYTQSKSATIWYAKDTPVDLVFSREIGYTLLNHVRRERSPSIPNLGAALKARATALKELADDEDARRQEADALAQTLGVPASEV